MDSLRQDLRLALRQLRRTPAFTAIVAATLAIGIGANAAIFSVIDAILVRPLPYPTIERVGVIWNASAGAMTHNASSADEYYDLVESREAFDGTAALQPQSVTVTGDGIDPERVSGYFVTPNLFSILGVSPALGRGFAAEDGVAGGEPVVLLSHRLWTRRFGADPGIVGRLVSVSGVRRTVVGVMPAAVRFPDAPVGWLREPGDLWLPLAPRHDLGRGNQNLAILMRRKSEMTPAQAERALGVVSARLRTDYPRYQGKDNWHFESVPLRDQMVGSVRPVLLVIALAVGFVLLIACANVANLLFARGTARRREIALRLALGADRGRILRQLLTESTVLAALGGLLGLGLARLLVPLLVRLGPDIPRLQGTGVNARAAAFVTLISLGTGILVGVAPGLEQARTDFREAMADGSKGATEGRGRRRLRTALVALEVALALVVLVAAGLLGRTFAAILRVEPGFRPERVLTLELGLPRNPYDSIAKVARFYDRLLPELAAFPGVAAASAVYPVPMGGDGWSGSFDVEGRVTPPNQPGPHAEYSVAAPAYFRAAGIPIVAGREFDPTDRADAPPVAIVDEQLALRYWPGEAAVGKRITANGGPGEWATIVGVVGHVRKQGPTDVGEPQLYRPLAQTPERRMALVIRGTDRADALADPVRAAIKRIDPDLAPANVRPMEALVETAVAPQRFNLLMLSGFAAAALVLATIGLYGVMSYLVSQRTREIGIRIALGGRPGDVSRMVVRESLVIATIGLGVGIAISMALSSVVGKLLYGVAPTDPVTYATITTGLLGVAVLAAYAPARRAARIDPLTALRH